MSLVRLALATACIALAACGPHATHAAAPSPPPAPSDAAAPASERRTVGGYTYTTDPVEARLGPHVFRFPANYYYSQMGPDFQGNFSLVLQWPDLEPMPPGVDFGDEMETFRRSIRISPDYVDRVPIETLLQKFLEPIDADDPVRRRDPTANLDLRTASEGPDGLIRYSVDPVRLNAYADWIADKPRYAINPAIEAHDDWYVLRDEAGELAAVIECTSHLLPDGVQVEGDRLVRQETPSVAICRHDFVIPELSTRVGIVYKRAFLKDWQRIETHVRNLFDTYRKSH